MVSGSAPALGCTSTRPRGLSGKECGRRPVVVSTSRARGRTRRRPRATALPGTLRILIDEVAQPSAECRGRSSPPGDFFVCGASRPHGSGVPWLQLRGGAGGVLGGGYLTLTGLSFQMSLAYSVMVRSLENLPTRAVLRTAIFDHLGLSWKTSPTLSCVSQ